MVNPFDRFGDHLRIALRAPASYQLLTWLESGPGAPLPKRGEPPSGGHWVVCGYGRFGREVTHDLRAEGYDVTIVEPGEAAENDPDAIVGRGYEPHVLAAAGVERAAGFVAGTDNDTTNLSLVAAAHRANPRMFVAARQNKPTSAPLFAAVDLDALLVPAEVVAHEVYAQLSTPLLWRFLREMPARGDDWADSVIGRLTDLCGKHLQSLWKVRLSAAEAPALQRRLRPGTAAAGRPAAQSRRPRRPPARRRAARGPRRRRAPRAARRLHARTRRRDAPGRRAGRAPTARLHAAHRRDPRAACCTAATCRRAGSGGWITRRYGAARPQTGFRWPGSGAEAERRRMPVVRSPGHGGASGDPAAPREGDGRDRSRTGAEPPSVLVAPAVVALCHEYAALAGSRSRAWPSSSPTPPRSRCGCCPSAQSARIRVRVPEVVTAIADASDASEPRPRDVLAIPLVGGGDLAGVLELDPGDRHGFPADERELAEVLAVLLTLSLGNAAA